MGRMWRSGFSDPDNVIARPANMLDDLACHHVGRFILVVLPRQLREVRPATLYGERNHLTDAVFGHGAWAPWEGVRRA